MNTFAKLLQREFWEHRGAFLVTPVVIGGFWMLLLLVALVSVAFFTAKINGADLILGDALRQFARFSEARRAVFLNNGLAVTSWLFLVVMGVVLVFYLIASLYDDRKDRSILFWKSLPISDSHTVLSKFASAVLFVPLVYLLLIAATQLLTLLFVTMVVWWVDGVPVWATLWHPVAFTRLWGDLLLGLMFTGMWWAPLYAWLMLCSALARRSPWLWAFGVPFAASFFEAWLNFLGILNTHGGTIWKWLLQHVANGMTMKGLRVNGEDFAARGQGALLHMFDRYADTSQFASADLWFGLLIAALLLTVTVYLRRHRSEV